MAHYYFNYGHFCSGCFSELGTPFVMAVAYSSPKVTELPSFLVNFGHQTIDVRLERFALISMAKHLEYSLTEQLANHRTSFCMIPARCASAIPTHSTLAGLETRQYTHSCALHTYTYTRAHSFNTGVTTNSTALYKAALTQFLLV